MTRVILHDLSHGSTLWVKDCETRTNFLWKREKIELLAELSMVSLRGFLHALLECAKVVFRSPGCSINSLQLLVLFITAPIGSSDTREREGLTNHSSVWKVWAATQVTPLSLAGGWVDVVVNR